MSLEQDLLKKFEEFANQNPSLGNWIKEKAMILQGMALENGTTNDMFHFYLMLAMQEAMKNPFAFGANHTINIAEMQEEQYFLQFIVGLVKLHIDRLDDENVWKTVFEVSYQWGGAGNDWVDLHSWENPDFCIAIGIAGGTLSYTIYTSGENGDNDGGNCLDKEVVTMEEINQFIKSLIDDMFVDGGFDKYESHIYGNNEDGAGYEPDMIP